MPQAQQPLVLFCTDDTSHGRHCPHPACCSNLTHRHRHHHHHHHHQPLLLQYATHDDVRSTPRDHVTWRAQLTGVLIVVSSATLNKFSKTFYSLRLPPLKTLDACSLDEQQLSTVAVRDLLNVSMQSYLLYRICSGEITVTVTVMIDNDNDNTVAIKSFTLPELIRLVNKDLQLTMHFHRRPPAAIALPN